MKITYITLLLLMFNLSLLTIACDSNNSKKEIQASTKLDKTWLEFENALELRNVDFLTNNSLDSVTCTDCSIPTTNSQDEYFDSHLIFNNYFDKLKHVESLKDHTFDVYQVNPNTIRVVYNIESSEAPEGGYGLIFTLVKKKGSDKYFFGGMIVQ